MLFSRSSCQRDVQHLHQQLWLRHRDHHGEGFASKMDSSPPASGLVVPLPGSMQVPLPEPMVMFTGVLWPLFQIWC